jgi:hypothetical protein
VGICSRIGSIWAHDGALGKPGRIQKRAVLSLKPFIFSVLRCSRMFWCGRGDLNPYALRRQILSVSSPFTFNSLRVGAAVRAAVAKLPGAFLCFSLADRRAFVDGPRLSKLARFGVPWRSGIRKEGSTRTVFPG